MKEVLMRTRQLEQEKTKLQEKMDKLINEGGMLQKATQSTEDQIKEIDKELSKKTN